MVTLNQIVYDILNIASQGTQSDDFSISERQCALWVNELRSKLIHQAIQKKGDINDSWLQHINCLELQEVDAAECCDVDTDCTVLKSITQLPSYIEIVSVRDILNKTTFSPITFFRAKYTSGNRYTANRPKWYMKDRYLYIINSNILEKVSLSGVFEDPTALGMFTSCEGTPCYNIDSNYPLDLKMATDITDIILQTKIPIFMQMPKDNINDANSNIQISK
jgi:hypothetical protein